MAPTISGCLFKRSSIKEQICPGSVISSATTLNLLILIWIWACGSLRRLRTQSDCAPNPQATTISPLTLSNCSGVTLGKPVFRPVVVKSNMVLPASNPSPMRYRRTINPLGGTPVIFIAISLLLVLQCCHRHQRSSMQRRVKPRKHTNDGGKSQGESRQPERRGCCHRRNNSTLLRNLAGVI